MRIRVLSDLHLEFSPFVPPAVPCDLVVLAGDIHRGAEGMAWSRATFGATPVVYVSGNHEYYGGDWDAFPAQLRAEAERHGVALLDRGTFTLGGVRVLGCTLWTDFDLYGTDRRDEAMAASERCLHDYRAIARGTGRLRAAQVRERHLAERAWLERELASRPEGTRATVVVTHMTPSWRSTAERFRPDLSSAGFSSHLDELVRQADLWVHGHTHDNFDYEEGGCRVLCNPRGYVRRSGAQENRGFRPGLVVEVGA